MPARHVDDFRHYIFAAADAAITLRGLRLLALLLIAAGDAACQLLRALHWALLFTTRCFGCHLPISLLDCCLLCRRAVSITLPDAAGLPCTLLFYCYDADAADAIDAAGAIFFRCR